MLDQPPRSPQTMTVILSSLAPVIRPFSCRIRASHGLRYSQGSGCDIAKIDWRVRHSVTGISHANRGMISTVLTMLVHSAQACRMLRCSSRTPANMGASVMTIRHALRMTVSAQAMQLIACHRVRCGLRAGVSMRLAPVPTADRHARNAPERRACRRESEATA